MICIVTEYVYPPIPMRDFDWRAYDQDNPEYSIYGWGKTEEEAINDLLESVE